MKKRYSLNALIAFANSGSLINIGTLPILSLTPWPAILLRETSRFRIPSSFFTNLSMPRGLTVEVARLIAPFTKEIWEVGLYLV